VLFSRAVRDKASTVGRSDALCNCESVIPTFDRLAVEALSSVAPLYLSSESKKCHHHLRLLGWQRLRFRQPGDHVSFFSTKV
jgi:hypothetical protein